MLQGPDDPKPAYSFELTTSFFAIDNSGYVIVNQENLDRDPPSPGTFRFQVCPFACLTGNIIISAVITKFINYN